mgnify:CR=1 FL=1
MTSPTTPPDPYQTPGASPHPAGARPSDVPDPYGVPAPTSTVDPGGHDAQQPPSAGQLPYGPPQSGGTDGVSIAALITGILGTGLIAVGLGIAGLVRIRRSRRGGKGFAITGIVLGSLATVAWIAAIGLLAALFTDEDVQAELREGFNEGYQQSMGLDMVVGDCFDTPADLMSGDPMVPADCAAAHDAEVIAVDVVAGQEFPGDDAVLGEVETLCLDSFARYIGTEYADSELDLIYFYPTQASWTLGDRLMLCAAVTMDGSPLEGSVEGAGI